MEIHIIIQIDDNLIAENNIPMILDQANDQLNDQQWQDQVIDALNSPNEPTSAHLILPTITSPTPSFGTYCRYLSKNGIIDEPTTLIWNKLTGHRTVLPNDPGLLADLTQGRVRIK